MSLKTSLTERYLDHCQTYMMELFGEEKVKNVFAREFHHRDHSFSTFAKFSEKLTFLTP